MTTICNYDDVLGQMRDAGLLVDSLEPGRLMRCKVEGDREKRGWYIIHELRLDNDDWVYVGSFGIWQGNDNGATRIELKKRELTADQKAAIRTRLAEDRRRAAGARKAAAEKAARRAEAVWKKCHTEGHCEYLDKKGVGAHGVRFTDRGNLVIPIHDVHGRVHGLQIIYGNKAEKERKGRDKDYWPAGLTKRGNFFLIGAPVDVVIVAEGYATAATLHEATGLPVAVAFDAGNLLPVAEALRKRYRNCRFLIGADDDFATFGNPGISAANASALAVSGSWVAPVFKADPLREAVAAAVAEEPVPDNHKDWKERVRPVITGKQKLTDFNDLHASEGLHLVRSQIEDKLQALGWDRPPAPTRPPGELGDDETDFNFSIDILLDQYALIYGTETVFDHRRTRIIGLSALRAAAGKSLVRMWLEHPMRSIVLPEQVGFDPTGTDKNITCNLWAGWPTVPKAGSCDRLLELLEYLCGEEDNPREIFQWILKWLAYPIQNPGVKMQTALLMHGPEGTGKNTFFGCIRNIYDRYGGIFSQSELESQFNGWASGKLFMIGNEVVTRVELYHQQGRLKNMVTETEWQVNEKNLPMRMEANHCNFVFFSNRVDIAKLDKEDRRYCVVWTPPAIGESFYLEVAEEIKNGGSAALHHYLLNLDLGDFNAHTKPPMTRAKRELIELGMDSTERFWRDWTSGELPVPCVPCKSSDLYKAYQLWGRAQGVPKLAQLNTLIGTLAKKQGIQTGPINHFKSTNYLASERTKSRCVIPPDHMTADDYRHDGITEKSKWITDCITAFQVGLDAMGETK